VTKRFWIGFAFLGLAVLAVLFVNLSLPGFDPGEGCQRAGFYASVNVVTTVLPPQVTCAPGMELVPRGVLLSIGLAGLASVALVVSDVWRLLPKLPARTLLVLPALYVAVPCVWGALV
jgi:hypothetical protein